MKKIILFILPLLCSIITLAQTSFTVWDFNNQTALPSVGNGTLTNLGGITFTYASGAAGGGSSDPAAVNNAYNTTSYPAQGTAPKTAGIQVAVSTAGYQNIRFRFDQRLSNTANNTYVVQYTTDITAAMPVWIDAQTFTFTPAPTGTGDVWYNLRNTDLSAVSALNDNPNAAFRIVSDYDPVAGTYVAARSTSNYATSGTSRFDMITISGDAIIPPVPFQIEFVGNDKNVNENTGTTNLYAVVNVVGNMPASFDVSVSSTSNAVLNNDYSLPNTTFTLLPSMQAGDQITIPVNIVDDGDMESDEYIVTKFSNGNNVNFSASDQYVLYIKDNDKVIPVASDKLHLEFVTSFSNGAAGTNSAEIVAYDSLSRRLFIANSIGGKLDIVDFSNPAGPVLISSVNITTYGNINSVAVRNGIVAMAIENGADPQQNGYIVFLDTNGVFLNQVNAGAMPDMILFNHAGTKVYTANEGEPNSAYTSDPEGSITVVDLSGGVLNAMSSIIDFTAYNPQMAGLKAQGVRIFGPNATVAQDFEPEYITIAEDDSKAWVSLQENNALAEIDLITNMVTAVHPLGFKNYNLTENSLDISNTTIGINSAAYPVKGIYMPDAIAQYTDGGNIYVLSANEGDSREYAGYSEIKRVSNATYLLDPVVFPNAAELKNNSLLGRLNITTANGDIDNDGDFDEIYAYGARSFSVWNVSGPFTQVYDSKNDLELITENHPVYSAMFNASNGAGVTVKDRSDDKGPEPEGIAVAKINNTPYAFLALERIGGVMVYDITNPAAPQYVTYQNNRGPYLGAEGIICIPASQSADLNNYVILANEISSTLSIYKVEENCSGTPSAGTVTFVNDTICAGQTDTLVSSVIFKTRGVSYQWQENTGINWVNVAPGNGDTTTTYITPALSSSTQYRLIATCTNSNEKDTSDVISIVVNPSPAVIIVSSSNNICQDMSAVLTASGAESYSWTNGVNNSIPFVPASTNTYTVTGVDAEGCSATATETITVNSATTEISLATALNGASLTGTAFQQQLHPQNSGLTYYTANCNMIATISDNTNDMGNTTVTTTVENTIQTHNGQPFVRRWFQVVPDTNTNAAVILYLTQDDFDTYNTYAAANNWPLLPANAGDIAAIANVRITKNDNGGFGLNPLSIIPDSITYNNISQYWALHLHTPGFSQFRIHAANPDNVPLPVEWLSFTGEKINNAHQLNWKTANEMNNKQYIIEQSADAVHFTSLVTVLPNASMNYTYTNYALLSGTNYYRIIQEDIDGRKNISKVISLQNDLNNSLFSYYPNPVTDRLNIALNTDKAQQVTVEIFDMTGRKLNVLQYNAVKGDNKKEISFAEYNRGMYQITLHDETGNYHTMKVMKK